MSPSRLSVAQRFAALIVVSALAIAIPSVLHGLDTWAKLQGSQREVEGLQQSRALLDLVRLAQQHRGLSAVWLGGREDQAAVRTAKADEVDRAAADVEARLAQGTPAGARLQERWRAASAAWQALRAEVQSRQVDGPTSSARHTAAIGLMLAANRAVVDDAGLAFDPQPETYYLAIGTLQEAPAMIETMGQLRARGANLLAAGGRPPAAERQQYGALADTLARQLLRVGENLQSSVERSRGDTAALKAVVDEFGSAARHGAEYIRTQVVQPETLTLPAAAFVHEMTVVIDGMYVSLDKANNSLAAALQQRVRAQRTGLGVMLALVFSLFGAAVGLAVYTDRWMRHQLGAEPAALRDAAARVAAGDLASPIACHAGDQDSVMAAMARMRDALIGVVGAVRDNAAQVDVASREIAQGNQDLSARTESQASALEQTAASMEQLRTTIAHSAESAREASRLAGGAREVAGEGGSAVASLASTMQEIQDSSHRIAEIVGTIDGIAFQTNILALNAAVEAARAGEQGRGFAVVASEVRALAQRASTAAREIRSLIAASVERVEAGGAQGVQAASTMRQVVASIERVAQMMGEVSGAAQEQNAGIAQVADAVAQMDQVTQQNAALVEQSAAAAESLRQQSAVLQKAVAAFSTAPA